MTNHERLELERVAAIKVRNARAAIIQSRPFYAVLVGQVETKASWQFPTMATDSKTHFYNPAFIETLSPAEVEGICVHESEHDARHHSTRRKGRDPKKWNEACDYAINGDIIAQGFKLPEGGLFRKEFFGKSAEEIYRILLIEQQQQRQQPQEGDGDDDTETQKGDGSQDQPSEDEESEDEAEQSEESEDEDEAEGEKPEGEDEEEGESEGGNGDGESGDGETDGESENGTGDGESEDGESGNGSGDGEVTDREPYSCGEVLDAPGSDAEKADTDAKWEVVTREAVALAKKKGSLPGHWATLIEKRKTPTQDWRTILREYIDAGARRIETWNRPNRRFVHSGLILPGSQRDGVNKVVFIIDASGSMLGQHIKVANELQAALDDGAISEVVLIYIDTEIYQVDRFFYGDQITFGPIRGGGTAMLPAYHWVRDNESDASLIVCLTDLYIDTMTPADEPDCPVLWAAYGDPRSIKSLAGNLPWGRVIDVDNE